MSDFTDVTDTSATWTYKYIDDAFGVENVLAYGDGAYGTFIDPIEATSTTWTDV